MRMREMTELRHGQQKKEHVSIAIENRTRKGRRCSVDEIGD